CGRPAAWDPDFWSRLWPTCGDGVRAGAEECDGQNAAACPGRCRSDCTCAPPGPGVCGDNLIDSGEQCDGTQPGVCPQTPFATQCVPPGSPSECQCCSDNVCQYDGISIPCCPGLTCVPTGGVHTQALCQ